MQMEQVLYVGDLDRDGDLDIVSTSELDDTIAWYENVRPTGTANPQAVATLRFDSQHLYNSFWTNPYRDMSADELMAMEMMILWAPI